MMSKRMKEELVEAHKVIESLNYAEHIQSSAQRWLVKRWPQFLEGNTSELKEIMDDDCIPESFQRDISKSSILLGIVKSSMEAYVLDSASLLVPDVKAQMPDLECLSDVQVIENLPCLLKFINRKALLSLYHALKGKYPKSNIKRYVLEQRICRSALSLSEKCDGVLSAHLLEVVYIVREPASKMLDDEHTSEVLKTLPMPSLASEFEAIQWALGQLDSMPRRSLLAMLDLLSGNPVLERFIEYNNRGKDKQRLTKVIREKANNLLKEYDGGRFPMCLDRALHVVSLVTVELYGTDGNLSKYLRPISSETEELQMRLRMSVSAVEELNISELQEVYDIIFGEMVQKPQQNNMVEKVQNALRDALYRCDHKSVPKFIIRVLDIINMMVLHTHSHSRKRRLHRQMDAVECLMTLSAHIQQTLRNQLERSTLTFEKQKNTVKPPNDVEQKNSLKPQNDIKDSFLLRGQAVGISNSSLDGTLSAMKGEQDLEDVRSGCQRPRDSNTVSCLVEDLDEDNETASVMENVGDHAAVLAHVIVGRAMEQRAVGLLKEPVQKYLKTGTGKIRSQLGHAANCEDEVALMLEIVETIPELTKSTLERIRARLSIL